MAMHVAPQTPREQAFAAAVLLRSERLNTMIYWEDGFDWVVQHEDGSIESSRPLQLRAEQPPLAAAAADATDDPTSSEAHAVLTALRKATVAMVAQQSLDAQRRDAESQNPNTVHFYDRLYSGKYDTGQGTLEWQYESPDRMLWYRRVGALPFFASAGRYLDIGCGIGGLLASLPPAAGRALHGIDFSPVAISKTSARITGDFVVGRAEALPYPDQSFDRVSCTETLEHVDDPETIIVEMARVLRSGGKLLITVPEASLDLLDHQWPGGINLHINKFTIASLSEHLQEAGLAVEWTTIDEREIWLIATK